VILPSERRMSPIHATPGASSSSYAGQAASCELPTNAPPLNLVLRGGFRGVARHGTLRGDYGLDLGLAHVNLRLRPGFYPFSSPGVPCIRVTIFPPFGRHIALIETERLLLQAAQGIFGDDDGRNGVSGAYGEVAAGVDVVRVAHRYQQTPVLHPEGHRPVPYENVFADDPQYLRVYLYPGEVHVLDAELGGEHPGEVFVGDVAQGDQYLAEVPFVLFLDLQSFFELLPVDLAL
jgi:hypothetical protein